MEPGEHVSEGGRDRRTRHTGTQAGRRVAGRRAARRLGGATRRDRAPRRRGWHAAGQCRRPHRCPRPRRSRAAPGPEEVEEVFRVLAGEDGVSLDDWEIDEQHLSDAGALPPGRCPSPCSDRRSPAGTPSVPWPGHSTSPPTRQLALTAAFLEREGVVRVLADPDAGTEHIRTEAATSSRPRAATGATRPPSSWPPSSASSAPPPHASAREPAGSPPPQSNGVLGLHAHLDGEQADGVRALLTSGNGYDLVIGQAGTGKSTMLGAARIGWEEAGFRVIGTAVAATDGRRPRGRYRDPQFVAHPAPGRPAGRRWTDRPPRDRPRRGVDGRQPPPRPSSAPTSMRQGPSSSCSATTGNCPPSTPVGRCAPSRGSWALTSSPSPPTAARPARTSSGNATPSSPSATATSPRRSTPMSSTAG